MKNDPYQLVNLAEDEKFKAKKEELIIALNKWRKQTGDVVDNPQKIKTRQLTK